MFLEYSSIYTVLLLGLKIISSCQVQFTLQVEVYRCCTGVSPIDLQSVDSLRHAK